MGRGRGPHTGSEPWEEDRAGYIGAEIENRSNKDLEGLSPGTEKVMGKQGLACM